MASAMQAFLESKDVKKALNQSQSALAALTVLKKVTNTDLKNDRSRAIIGMHGVTVGRCLVHCARGLMCIDVACACVRRSVTTRRC